MMRIIIANQNSSFRFALQMFFQTQENMMVVAEISRVGELLRDAPSVAPDLILLDWDLPDIEHFSVTGRHNKSAGTPNLNQVKAVVISSLHNIESNPKILVTDNHQDDLHSALYAGADAFLYMGEMSSMLPAILKSLTKTLE